ncbi:hypothetical protein COV04_01750 [Candidatus Uhrbacteria bacterium CG10_big_fil_rev_8_21_14_0_10_48_11]|uniref:Uncharacterized protein n=1 Tax=Candidatus Uhrbacteria bacterium CG10_big_fil_rev_8_21_14_0_10_48_11 TaxID=1975037 RepID=A0A2M8LF44_9BACT|nr:MAG: hypothetical protein COV04_01750 [Candidatus Uhrbacteria bacterium CG10_big_fil_rev_8_21_14_0_10_48_11]
MTKEQLGQSAVSFVLEFGFTLAITLFVFTWLGRKADLWLGTTPWLSLVGLFLGLLFSGLWTYRKIKTFKP